MARFPFPAAHSGHITTMLPLLDRYLALPAGQSRSLEHVAHRPWPLRHDTWLMGQTWQRLLFAHWAVEPELLRPLVPPALELETFDGTAWLGVTPFRVDALRVRGMLPAPLVSSFPELNVRTYVTYAGRPGVLFLRLDTPSRGAIAAARACYRLPYDHARIGFAPRSAARTVVHARNRLGTIELDYEATGPVFEAVPGTLDHFLTERYRLYTTDGDGRARWADIHHPPWPLQQARATIEVDGYLPHGLELPGEPILHVSQRQDVVIWPLSGAHRDPRDR